MRSAVIADIHSDLLALDRVLSAIALAEVDAIWCLGDVVGLGGTDPARVVEVIRRISELVVAGNHDRWVSGDLPLDMLPLASQRSELRWQQTQLSSDERDWLCGLPSQAAHGDVELWHGSAADPITGWISSESDAAEHLARQSRPIGLVGHTHRPMLAVLEDGHVRWTEQPNRGELGRSSKAVLNPGAVTAEHRWLELAVDQRVAVWHRA